MTFLKTRAGQDDPSSGSAPRRKPVSNHPQARGPALCQEKVTRVFSPEQTCCHLFRRSHLPLPALFPSITHESRPAEYVMAEPFFEPTADERGPDSPIRCATFRHAEMPKGSRRVPTVLDGFIYRPVTRLSAGRLDLLQAVVGRESPCPGREPLAASPGASLPLSRARLASRAKRTIYASAGQLHSARPSHDRPAGHRSPATGHFLVTQRI